MVFTVTAEAVDEDGLALVLSIAADAQAGGGVMGWVNSGTGCENETPGRGVKC
jgi:hypothetical protein